MNNIELNSAIKNNGVYQTPVKSPANIAFVNNIMPNDEFCFQEMYVDLKGDETTSEDRNIIVGKVNGFDCRLRRSSIRKNDDVDSYIEGKIGDSKISYKAMFNIKDKNNNTTYEGTINNKQFNIKSIYRSDRAVTKTLFGLKLKEPPQKVTIVGTFDNKPIKIEIPKAKIPADKDLKNLMAIIFNENCLSPEIYKGEIVGVSWKANIYDNYEKRVEKQEQSKKENINPLLQGVLSEGLKNAFIPIVSALLGALLVKIGITKPVQTGNVNPSS